MTDTISRDVDIMNSTLARLAESNGTLKQDRRANPEMKGSASWGGTDMRGGLGAAKARCILM